VSVPSIPTIPSLARRNGAITVAPSGGGPAPFLLDTFTDVDASNLTAHTPEIGGAWAKHPLAADNLLIASAAPGSVYSDGGISNFSTYHNAATPPSANYSITATIKIKSLPSGAFVVVQGRGSTTVDTAYKLLLTLTTLQLTAVVAAASTTLQTYTLAGGDVLNIGDTKTITLTMTGTTITGSIGGVVQCSGTDSQIASAGKALIRVRNSTATTGLHFDQVTAA
jgi:hypothetical protein